MLHVHRAQKIFYCPLKSNRKVGDSSGKSPYTAMSALQWSEQDAALEKRIKVYGFLGAIKVKLFRIATTNSRAEWVVTNDAEQTSIDMHGNMCDPLENREVSSGGQTDARHREMPVQVRKGTEKSYWLRDPRLEPHDCLRPKHDDKYLRPQRESAIQLHETGACSAFGANVDRLNQLQKPVLRTS